MKPIKPIFVAMLSAIALSNFSSCEKDYNATPSGDVAKMFAGMKDATQKFKINAGGTVLLKGSGGTAIKFYPNSFKDANGNIITSGEVDIELDEAVTPGDMILNGAGTMGQDGLLQSGGEVKITATQNGQQLRANNYALAFKQKSGSTTPMQLFFSSQNGGGMTWSGNSNATGAATEATTSSSEFGDFVYLFDSVKSFNWVNCDRYLTITDSNRVCKVILPDNTFVPNMYGGAQTISNTIVYIYLHETNSMLMFIGIYNKSANSIELKYFGRPVNLPLNMRYTILATADKNGEPYFGSVTGTITADMNINLPMEKATKEAIKARLKAL